MKILIFGLSWLWFLSVEKVFTKMKSHQRIWKKMNKKSEPTYTINSSLRTKSENDNVIFEDSLEVWNLIQSDWFFFLQFSRTLKLCNSAKPPWKSNLMFLLGNPIAYVYHNFTTNFLKFWDLPLAHRPWRFFLSYKIHITKKLK
jgi:hypothetical protein